MEQHRRTRASERLRIFASPHDGITSQHQSSLLHPMIKQQQRRTAPPSSESENSHIRPQQLLPRLWLAREHLLDRNGTVPGRIGTREKRKERRATGAERRGMQQEARWREYNTDTPPYWYRIERPYSTPVQSAHTVVDPSGCGGGSARPDARCWSSVRRITVRFSTQDRYGVLRTVLHSTVPAVPPPASESTPGPDRIRKPLRGYEETGRLIFRIFPR
jgi:hypothetical protein